MYFRWRWRERKGTTPWDGCIMSTRILQESATSKFADIAKGWAAGLEVGGTYGPSLSHGYECPSVPCRLKREVCSRLLEEYGYAVHLAPSSAAKKCVRFFLWPRFVITAHLMLVPRSVGEAQDDDDDVALGFTQDAATDGPAAGLPPERERERGRERQTTLPVRLPRFAPVLVSSRCFALFLRL